MLDRLIWLGIVLLWYWPITLAGVLLAGYIAFGILLWHLAQVAPIV
jgi:hypothetical protein